MQEKVIIPNAYPTLLFVNISYYFGIMQCGKMHCNFVVNTNLQWSIVYVSTTQYGIATEFHDTQTRDTQSYYEA